jgi:hypothetical protein
MLIGYEDIISLQKKFTSTVRCISVTAEVLVISAKDFVQRVNNYKDTWNYMKDAAKNK